MTVAAQIRRSQNLLSQILLSQIPLIYEAARAPDSARDVGMRIASAPLKDTPRIVATPQPGQLNVTTQPGPPIGDVQPVYVSVANGSDVPRSIVPSQIFALNDSGARVAPLPPGEAARQAGGSWRAQGRADQRRGGRSRGGSARRRPGGGDRVGGERILGLQRSGERRDSRRARLGGGSGIVSGVQSGANKADQQANAQLRALALQGGEIRHDFTVRAAMCFFPRAAITKSSFCWSTRRPATPK